VADEGDALTSPLRFAVSGDVPAHSWVSAPCSTEYIAMFNRDLVNEPSKPVNGVVGSGEQLEGLLSRLTRFRARSLLITPIQRERE